MSKGVWIGLALLVTACQSDNNRYEAVLVRDGVVLLDGIREEKVWEEVKTISNFQNPWNEEVAPPTKLQLFHDGEMLYFFFDVEDQQILLEKEFNVERDLEKEDRVELFFSKDAEMEEYYCFEVDAQARVLTYSAKNYRQMDYAWEAPEGFEVRSRINSEGYSVEGKIPMSFMKTLTRDGLLYFGAYRAEFSKDSEKTVENWMTWVDPRTKDPDFHVPSSLGKLLLK